MGDGLKLCYIDMSVKENLNRAMKELLFTDNQDITVFFLDP